MNTNRSGRWILFGAVCYLVLAIFSTPASLLVNWLAPDHVVVSDVQGTAWRGSAQRISVDTVQATDVRWTFKPLSLFTLQAGAAVEAKLAGGQIKGDIYSSLFGDSGAARNLQAVVDISRFATMTGLPILVQGKAGIILSQVKWKAQRLTAIRGDVTLAELADTMTNTRLGTFEVTFPDDQGEQIRGVVRDADAIFTINGTLTVTVNGDYQFDALIEPTDQTPRSVVNALPAIGAIPDRDGNFTLNSSGMLYAAR